MLIQTSRIINLPLGALDDQNKIGFVKDFVINPEDGKLIAFIIKKGFLNLEEKFLASSSVLEFDPNGLVTKNIENLLNVDEIVRVKTILKSKIKVLGSRAYTKDKKYLGRVHDLLIDTENYQICKFYIGGFFEDRIIPFDMVIKIVRGKIIFNNDINLANIAVSQEATT